MNCPRFWSLGTVLIALAATAGAQRQWIVDAANGAGTDFTNIPPAVAAASHGDTLLVRSGTYDGFDTGKGITLLGQGSVVIVPTSIAFEPVVHVHGVPSGQAFVMKRVQVTSFSYSVAFTAADNAGRVHLEDVELFTSIVPATDLAACVVSNCATFTMAGGRALGYPAVSVGRSTAAFAGTTIQGGDACGSIRCTTVGFGLFSVGSTLHITNCAVTGGAGGSPFNPFARPKQAILSIDSALVLAGDSTTVRAGTDGTTALAGITADGGSIDLDPAVVVAGSSGGPDIDGTGSVVRRAVVGLRAAGVPPGATIATRVTAPTGDLFGLFLGLPTDAIALPLGVLYVDPLRHTLVTFGVGPTNVPIPVPADPVLGGAAFALQASCLCGTNQRIELSNPVVIVLD